MALRLVRKLGISALFVLATAVVGFGIPLLWGGVITGTVLDEAREAARLFSIVAGRLPDGPARAALPPLPPGGDAVSCVEAWRGPVWYWVWAAGPQALRRVKIVDPSFRNWPALELAVLDNIVPDFPLCNKSFNLSYSGHDL